MKKPIRFLLMIAAFVFCLAFVGVNLVQAENTPGKNPWVHTYVYNPYVKAKDVQVSNLPAVYTNANGLFEPEGVALDEGQFGGNFGVVITGLATGSTARACFDFPTYRYGWRGAVYMYSDGSWIPLRTTISTSYQNPDIWACANYVHNGTYALVIHYTGSSH